MSTTGSKVFGIGLSKTGTSSLASALEILGYQTKDNMGVTKYAAGDLSSIDLRTIESHDALTDTPIPSFYRELDAKFPGSKFILTIRDSDGWLRSCQKQFTQRFAENQTDAHKRLFIDLYGTDVFDATLFANGYQRFLSGVTDYFKDRKDDLLMINVVAGEGWEKLCRFLDKPIPDIPFPKANVTQITWMVIDDIVSVAIDGGKELMRRYERASSASDDHRGRSRGLRSLLSGAIDRMVGEGTPGAAVAAANRVISRGLFKLDSQVPIVSRAGIRVPYAERRDWNHFWLVDPLDGEDAFVNGMDMFSVNVALIEDGRPVYGVVYAPAADAVYYGRVGRGAYLRVRNNPPIQLATEHSKGHALHVDLVPKKIPSMPPLPGQVSQALSMCARFDGRADANLVFHRSLEWQTAAPHAILRSAGIRVSECDSGKDLSYNKPEVSNTAFIIR